jgi:hypothetical protein
MLIIRNQKNYWTFLTAWFLGLMLCGGIDLRADWYAVDGSGQVDHFQVKTSRPVGDTALTSVTTDGVSYSLVPTIKERRNNQIWVDGAELYNASLQSLAATTPQAQSTPQGAVRRGGPTAAALAPYTLTPLPDASLSDFDPSLSLSPLTLPQDSTAVGLAPVSLTSSRLGAQNAARKPGGAASRPRVSFSPAGTTGKRAQQPDDTASTVAVIGNADDPSASVSSSDDDTALSPQERISSWADSVAASSDAQNPIPAVKEDALPQVDTNLTPAADRAVATLAQGQGLSTGLLNPFNNQSLAQASQTVMKTAGQDFSKQEGARYKGVTINPSQATYVINRAKNLIALTDDVNNLIYLKLQGLSDDMSRRLAADAVNYQRNAVAIANAFNRLLGNSKYGDVLQGGGKGAVQIIGPDGIDVDADLNAKLASFSTDTSNAFKKIMQLYDKILADNSDNVKAMEKQLEQINALNVGLRGEAGEGMALKDSTSGVTSIINQLKNTFLPTTDPNTKLVAPSARSK